MKQHRNSIARALALLLVGTMAFGMASCASKETATSAQAEEDSYWPEAKDDQKTSAKSTTTSADGGDSYWGTTSADDNGGDSYWHREEGDERAGQSFEESYEEGDQRAGQSFEESREGGDRAPSESRRPQGNSAAHADAYTLRIENDAFYMDETILGMSYQQLDAFFNGELPLLDAWEWDKRYTGTCSYYYNGHSYNFFFDGETLAAVRYEVEGDDVEKFLSKYMETFGGYGYRTDPNTGADIGLNENGYGYMLNANYSVLAVFLNYYDDLPHIAMQYELSSSKVNTLGEEDLGNDTPSTTKTTTTTTTAQVYKEPTDDELYLVGNAFFMDTFYLGCEYSYVNEKLGGGNLPLLDAWTWDDRFTGYCDYYYDGNWYTLFFVDDFLAAVRYEFEGDDLERYLDTYQSYYGSYEFLKNSSGVVIPDGESGYGYKFKTGDGSFVLFLNIYDGLPHVAMQYEVWS